MKKMKDPMQILKKSFYFFLIGVFCYFILGEILLPTESAVGGRNCEIFESEWVRVFPNGDRVTVEVPGRQEAYRMEAVIIETVLPDELEDGISLCFRSSQQDMEIYVDGILRQRYCTKDSRPFGKNSMSAYVFADLNSSDAGKTVRVITVSDSTYTGELNQVYIGNKSDIWNYFLYTYGIENLIALAIMLLSMITILVSVLLRVSYHRNVTLNYLGWGVFLTAVWIMTESRLRQFLMPNNSVFGSIAFFAIMLIPLPFLIYMNSIQKERYQKWYIRTGYVSIAMFLLCTVLQVLNIFDFLDTLILINGNLLFTCLMIGITLVKDGKRGLLREYRLIAVGAAGMIVSCCVEIMWVHQKVNQSRGSMVCYGLVFLLAMASIKTGQDLMQIEKETHLAIMVSQSKADFLANMSHEIRTPINTILGMNEMVLRENQDKEIQEYAEHIQRASNMLLALINDVLDYSKIDAGKLEIVESNYQVNTLLNDVVQVLESKAEEKGLQTFIHIDEKIPPYMHGDEIRIKQILHNLITNAVKYTPKGSVTFHAAGVKKEDGFFWFTISVEDTGIGIKEEDKKQLFDSFTRLEQDKNRSIEGTGLGLSITKQLIELMNGTITVDSVYSKGSKFTVMFPQKIVENMEEDFTESAERMVLEIHKDKAVFIPKASILAVDDNEMNLAVFKALLKRTKAQLDLVSSGEECLKYCKQKKYDLIFMDHMMPQMDGIETFHRLQNDTNHMNTDTKVIILTANAIAGSRELYLKEGFTDYLSKPVIGETLENMLRKYLADKIEVNEAETFERGNSKNESEEVRIEKEDCIENSTIMAEKNVPEKTDEKVSVRQEKREKLIDMELAMPYCCNSEEFFKEMLKVYYEQAQKYKKQLPEYYEQSNWQDYAVIVHAIKSTSLTIGASVLSERAKQHEMAAKGNDEEFLKQDWNSFYTYYCSVLDCAEGML